MNEKFLKYVFVCCLLFFLLAQAKAQNEITQTIRGRVVDRQSQMSIPGATVVISSLSPVKATISDMDGYYRLENVPIGRIDITCSFLGYAPQALSNIIISSGKEMLINFELEETAISLEEFVVKGYSRKDKPVNRMAVISARSFTLEETGRYAGSYGDPARMAANYAGVMTGRDNRNDIVIRGNSSMGVLWRLDDIEISNPSHYAALGTTGGPLTMLNSNMLANSDFLSGAFPAEFGNALSGVFDLKMRTGNNEKREHWFQTGWNGLEFGTEGPFSKKKKASYIVAYRYSILEIIRAAGIDLGLDPKYQDLNLKINLPYAKGRFDIIGLGGISAINIFDSKKKQKNWMFDEAGENVANSSTMGMLTLTNLHFLNEKTRVKSAIALTGAMVESKIDTFSLQNMTPALKAGEKSSEIRYTFSSTLKRKINIKSDIDWGVVFDIYDFSYQDSTLRNNTFIWDTDAQGQMHLLRTFAQYHYKFSDAFSLITGLNYQYLTLNKSKALEPRVALKWDVSALHSLYTGFGIHSQIQPRMTYFAQSLTTAGNYVRNNTGLDFSKSRHYVVGHDYLLNEYLRLKSELYYQSLYNIPVKPSLGAYSMLNSGVEYFVGREDSLVNDGTGRNYGIEMTLERFFNNNYFFLITASLYNSEYTGADNIKRSTAFNSNYLFNAVGGYEIKIGHQKSGALIFGLRFTWNGGRPYVPFDVPATLEKGYEVLDWENAYKVRHEDYKRLSLRIGIRRNRAKYSSEWVMDFQHRTDYTSIYIERIDVHTGKIHNYQKMSFYPLSTWKINF